MRRALSVGMFVAVAVAFAVAVPRTVGGDATGTVEGTVTVAHPPANKATKVTDANQRGVCGAEQRGEEVMARGGKLAGVVVWIDGAAAPAGLHAHGIKLGQQGCRFVPHVQTATKGAVLTITSEDSVLHNVHAFGDGDRTLFNLAIPVKGMSVRRPNLQPGRMRFKCDAGHTWMSAYIQVFPHPYHAVSGNNGAFEIEGLPAGSYTAHAWHERLGEKNARVTVTAGGTAELTFAY